MVMRDQASGVRDLCREGVREEIRSSDNQKIFGKGNVAFALKWSCPADGGGVHSCAISTSSIIKDKKQVLR